ncbi:S1C family serine protease [Oricola cellulosilytica]|nr:trypsin-like peptidase domain-containing protein [Oricola cellulosilytica]
MLTSGLAAVVLLSAAGFSHGAEWRNDIADRAKRSVVAVIPVLPRDAVNNDEPEGTGFPVRDGNTILTADHVLGPATSVRLRLSDRRMMDAEIVVRDPETDMALLRISERITPLLLDGKVTPGDDVCVAGNAFGLGISLTCGIVSATEIRGIGFNRIEDFVQTDAAVNPGMSGGPLFSRAGRVAGMASAIFTKERDGNLGVNFAASIRMIEAFLADGLDGSIDRRPQGLLLRAEENRGENGRMRAKIVRVVAGSPEEGGGLRQGDFLIAINGLAVKGQADYLFATMLFPAPDTLIYTIVRDGKTQSIPITSQMEEEIRDE